jgi:hypothetical protein
MTSLLPKKALTGAHIAFGITAAILVFGSAAQAQLLIDPTVSAYSSQDPYGIDRAAVHTVDGSGLTAGPSGILGAADSTYGSTSTGTMWTTAGNTGTPIDTNPYITYDLGAVHDLQTTRIWNYNEAGAGIAFGPSSILLSTSVDGTNFTVLTTLNPVEAVGGPAEIAQDFATAASGIRYVQMQILTNYDGAIFWSSITGTTNAGADGRFLTGLSQVRFVVFTVAPIIWQQPQPQSQTWPPGSNATFTVTATDSGFPPLTYYWRKNGTNLTDGGNISGATTSNLVISTVSMLDQANYDVVVANTRASVTSQVARLLIGGTLITPSISAFSSFYNTPPYVRNVTNLVENDFVPGEPGLSGPGYFYDTHDNGEDDVWHHAPGDNSPFVTFDLGGYYDLLITRYWNLNQAGFTQNGAMDVRISVSADNAAFTILGTNTLVQAGGTPAEPAQDFPTPASVIEFVKIEPLDGYGGGWNGLSAVRFEGNAVATSPPTITTQPVGWTNVEGNTAIFTITATDNGFPPLTYRWQKNGTNLIDGGNISGAATTDLTVASVTGADTGSYTVIVSNAVGHVFSVPAYLLVVLPPGLSLESGNGGTLITPSISAFSSYYNTSPYVRNVTNLVQNNFVAGEPGLTGPGYYTDTHDNGADDVWHHAPGDNNPYVTFDLGASYNLLITRIWNLNQAGATVNGAKDIRISVSADDTNYTILGTNTLGVAGGTTNEPAQDFATPASGTRYVKIEPLDGYGGGWNGLSAVRFVVAGLQRPLLLTASLQGIPGFHYQIQSVDLLGVTNDWQVLLDIPALLASPYNVPAFDGAALTNPPQQFYRAVVIWP